MVLTVWYLQRSLPLIHKQVYSRVLLFLYIHASLMSCVSEFPFFFFFSVHAALLLGLSFQTSD